METISPLPGLDRSKLRRDDYLQTLLEQGREAGCISPADLTRLQTECLALLAKRSGEYTGHESSSLPIETCRELLGSLQFTVGLALLRFPSPEDALHALKRFPLAELEKQGQRQITALLAQARQLHAQILSELFATRNVFYRATITGGISGFFRLYRPDFQAQEIHITADYPLCLPVTERLGIDFILSYLQRFWCENTFLCRFPPLRVHQLLTAYHREYRQMVLGLFEPVLCTAIGCCLSGGEIAGLRLGSEESAHLLSRLSPAERSATLRTAAEEVAGVLALPQEASRYIAACLPQITASVSIGLELGTLDKVFLPG